MLERSLCSDTLEQAQEAAKHVSQAGSKSELSSKKKSVKELLEKATKDEKFDDAQKHVEDLRKIDALLAMVEKRERKEKTQDDLAEDGGRPCVLLQAPIYCAT